MKKYVLAAAIATAPMVAATSADAITVAEGSNLSITITGTYFKVGTSALAVGDNLFLANTTVGLINLDGNGQAAYQGLVTGSVVGVSGLFNLGNGAANSGLQLEFADPDDSTFVFGESFDAFVSGAGTGSSGVVGLGSLSAAPGSFSYATSSDANSGLFTLTVAVPPDDEITNISAIPLPAAGWMLLAGLGSLWAFRRRTHA